MWVPGSVVVRTVGAKIDPEFGIFLSEPDRRRDGRRASCSRALPAPLRRKRRRVSDRGPGRRRDRSCVARRTGISALRAVIHARHLCLRGRAFAIAAGPRCRIHHAIRRSLLPSLACASRNASRSACAVKSFLTTTRLGPSPTISFTAHDDRAIALVARAFGQALHLEGFVDERLLAWIAARAAAAQHGDNSRKDGKRTRGGSAPSSSREFTPARPI